MYAVHLYGYNALTLHIRKVSNIGETRKLYGIVFYN